MVMSLVKMLVAPAEVVAFMEAEVLREDMVKLEVDQVISVIHF